jgi:hypothetical protein
MSTPTDIEANKELVRTYTQTVFNEHNEMLLRTCSSRPTRWWDRRRSSA